MKNVRTLFLSLAAVLLAGVLWTPAASAQQGVPSGSWSFPAVGSVNVPTLEVNADGSYRWGSTQARLREVNPAFAQSGVRYYAASPNGASQVVLGHAGERLDVFREDGVRIAEGRRVGAATSTNPLGIDWVTSGSGSGAPASTAPSTPNTPAPQPQPQPQQPQLPSPKPSSSNPLGVDWLGTSTGQQPSQPQPQPQVPAQPQQPGSSNPLGIDWLGGGGAPQPPAPSSPPNPPTSPPSGGGLGVEWQTGAQGQAPPAGGELPATHLPGVCTDPVLTSTITRVVGRAPQGMGKLGECDPQRYGGGKWKDAQELERHIRTAFKLPQPGVCRDPWITETITRVVGRAPQGQGDTGECDFRRYGGGTWGSKAELEAHVRAAFNLEAPPASKPTYIGYASHANPEMCMDVPGGTVAEGTPLQLWNCNGTEAQRFELREDGHLVAVGGKLDHRRYSLCVDYYPSAGNNGDAVRIWPCHPIRTTSDTQYWTRLPTGEFRSASGRCVDIQGGRASAGRQGSPLVLWDCPDPQNFSTRRWSEPAAAREAARHTPAPQAPKAPSGICSDPWVTEKIRLVTGHAPNGESSSGECDIRRYGGGKWVSKAELERHVQRAFGRPVSPVRGLYVIDGTDSKFVHQNAMWHLFKRWEDYAIWSDGVNLAASNIDALYKRMYDRICQDLKPVSQGGEGVQEVFIAGYSRGAIMSVKLSREVMRNCGANVRFVGLVDAVNTSIWNWPVDLDTRIPVRVHIRKPRPWEHVLTTRDIDNADRLLHPRDVDHKQIVCQDGSLDAWRWTVDQLVDHARRAGGPVGPARSEGTAC